MSHGKWGGARAAKARAYCLPLVAAGAPCYRCGKPILPGQRWDADHIVPRSMGGTDDPGNLWPAHSYTCNSSAGGKQGAAITNARRLDKREPAKGGTSERARGIRGL